MRSRYLSILVVLILVLGSYGMAHADNPPPPCGGNNGIDPCWKPSKEELARTQARNSM